MKDMYAHVKTNLVRKHLRYENASNYEDFEGNEVNIDYGISYHSVREQGWAVKGSTKKSMEIGEVVDSIIIYGEDSNETLEFGISDSIFLNNSTKEYSPIINRDLIEEFCEYCKENQLSIEGAYEHISEAVLNLELSNNSIDRFLT